MLPGNPTQTTVFVEGAKDVCFGAEAAWKERDGWKSKAIPLGKYLTDNDAIIFAIDMVLWDLPQTLSKTNHLTAEVVTKSRPALAEIQTPRRWVQRTITDTKTHVKRIEEKEGAVALTWLPSDISCNGYKIASTAAQRAAR